MKASKHYYLLITLGILLVSFLFMCFMIAAGNELYYFRNCKNITEENNIDRRLKDILSEFNIRDSRFTKFIEIFELLLLIFFLSHTLIFWLLDNEAWIQTVTRLLLTISLVCLCKGLISVTTMYPSPFVNSCKGLSFISHHSYLAKTFIFSIGPFVGVHSPVSSPISIDAAIATSILIGFVAHKKVTNPHHIVLVMFPTIAWIFLLLGFITVNICYTSEVIIAIIFSWFCEIVVCYSIVKSIKAKKENNTNCFHEFMLNSSISEEELREELNEDPV